MIKYTIKRLLIAIPVFLGITFIVFFLVNIAPGGPLDIMASSGELSQSDLEALKVSLGLDKPIIVRYFIWLGELFQGDLGTSYRTSQEVSLMIGQRLQASLILTGTGIVMAIIIGVPLGIISAYKPYSKWDSLANFIAFLGSSVPNFFLSLILIYVISVKLGWLPTSGMYSTSGNREFGDLVQHLILPAIVCGIQPIGNYIKQTRASVMEVLNEEYIKTARSKGLKENIIVVKHAFRNALIPVVTSISLSIPIGARLSMMMGMTVFVENVFAIPGIGSLMVTAINNRDYPVIMGVTVLISVVVLVANLILDLIYAKLDPRISYD